MSEFHPLHVKSRDVRSRKIKLDGIRIKRIRFICFTQTHFLVFPSTWPYIFLSIKTKEYGTRGRIPMERETNLFTQYTYLCYASIMSHIYILYFERERNFSTLKCNNVDIHVTQSILIRNITILSDAHLDFLLYSVTWTTYQLFYHVAEKTQLFSISEYLWATWYHFKKVCDHKNCIKYHFTLFVSSFLR